LTDDPEVLAEQSAESAEIETHVEWMIGRVG